MPTIEDNIREILNDLQSKSARGINTSKYIIAIKKIEAWLSLEPNARPELPDVDFEMLGYSISRAENVSIDNSNDIDPTSSNAIEIVDKLIEADQSEQIQEQQSFPANDVKIDIKSQKKFTGKDMVEPSAQSNESKNYNSFNLVDSIPDEQRIEKEEDARRLLENSQVKIRQRDFTSARDLLKRALEIAPWFGEAQDTLYRIDHLERVNELTQLKRKLENEQDIKALENSLTEAEELVDLLEDPEEKNNLTNLINNAKNRFDEKRSLQGQITSMEALVSVIDNVNGYIQVNQAIERNERTWYSVRKGDIIPISDALGEITINLQTKALETVERFRERASMYMPKIGFRYPQAALRYLDQNLGLEDVYEVSINPESLFENYSQDINNCNTSLKDKLNKIGVNQKDLQLVDLIDELRSNEQSATVNSLLNKLENKNITLSEQFYARMKHERDQKVDKYITFKVGGVDEISALFSNQELERQKVVEALKTWFDDINKLARKWTGRFVVAHLDENSREELREIVNDWKSQKEKWQDAQALIGRLQRITKPIEQISLLKQIRTAYPYHADLPKAEINVLKVAAPYLLNIVQSEIERFSKILPEEEQQAYEQRLQGSRVTEVESIPIFSKIAISLNDFRLSIDAIQEECDNIEQFSIEQRKLIQLNINRYYELKDSPQSLDSLVKKSLDEIQKTINVPSVTENAKTKIRQFSANISSHFLSLLTKSNSNYRVDQIKLDLIQNELDEFANYLERQKNEEEIKNIEVPSWIVADLVIYLDKLVMLQREIDINVKDIEQFNSLLEIIKESRVDIENIVNQKIESFEKIVNEKINWRKQIRKIFLDIDNILNEKDVETAYKEYINLEDDKKVDRELQFLYENKISPSLSDKEWIDQADLYFNVRKWESCIAESEKILKESVFYLDAIKLKTLSKMHISAEKISKYWTLEDYHSAQTEFIYLGSCEKESDELRLYFEENLKTKYDISNRLDELKERLSVDRENNLENRLASIEARIPGLQTRSETDLVGKNFQNVNLVSDALSELYDLKGLRSSKVLYITELFNWLGKEAGKQYQQYLSNAKNEQISEEILNVANNLYDLQSKYRIYSNAESRRLSREIHKSYLEDRDKSLISKKHNKAYIELIKNWEGYAHKFLDDYETGDLLNKRRMLSLLGFVDIALDKLDHNLALDILEKRFNPVNDKLPNQPCVDSLEEIPFNFSIYDTQELTEQRDSATILRKADSLYDDFKYQELADHLDESVEKNKERPEIKQKRNRLFGQMAEKLAEEAENAEDIFKKASAYALILILSDKGLEYNQAKSFFEDNSDQLQIKLKELKDTLSNLNIDPNQMIKNQLEKATEIEILTRSLIPVDDKLYPNKKELQNGLLSVLVHRSSLANVLKELELYSPDGHGWMECLETGNWGLIDKTLNNFETWGLSSDHPQYKELSKRREIHQERRSVVEDNRNLLEENFATNKFQEALENCDKIDKVLSTNDREIQPPVDIYGIISPDYSIYDEFSRENIYYFKQREDTQTLKELINSSIDNLNAWDLFNQTITEVTKVINPPQIQSLVETTDDWRKTNMDAIAIAIDKLIEVFLLFDYAPKLKPIVKFEVPMNKKPEHIIFDIGKLTKPNNILSNQLQTELRDQLEKLEDLYIKAQIKIDQFKEFEINLIKDVNQAISEIQNFLVDKAEDTIDKAIKYFANSKDKEDEDICKFLNYLEKIVKGIS